MTNHETFAQLLEELEEVTTLHNMMMDCLDEFWQLVKNNEDTEDTLARLSSVAEQMKVEAAAVEELCHA